MISLKEGVICANPCSHVYIVRVACKNDAYFKQQYDATNHLKLSIEQKCITTIRMLGYGVALGFLDDFCCMGGNIVDNSMNKYLYFCEKVFRV